MALVDFDNFDDLAFFAFLEPLFPALCPFDCGSFGDREREPPRFRLGSAAAAKLDLFGREPDREDF